MTDTSLAALLCVYFSGWMFVVHSLSETNYCAGFVKDQTKKTNMDMQLVIAYGLLYKVANMCFHYVMSY